MFGIMLSSVVALESKKFDFNNETLGAESKAFSALVGDWRIDKDGSNLVYTVGKKKCRGYQQALMVMQEICTARSQPNFSKTSNY